MSDYLLPCACGQKLPVSVRQAGQAVTCSCGARLDVPPLRGLRELEQAAARAEPSQRAWGDRQRVVFLLAALSLLMAAAAGFLALRMPAAPVREDPDAEIAIDERSPISSVYAAYQKLQSGLQTEPPIVTKEDRAILEQRVLMSWGVKIALVIAACTALAAVVGLLSGGWRKR